MFSVNLLRRNNNTLLVEQIGLQGYVMGMINFGAIRFAIAPYFLVLPQQNLPVASQHLLFEGRNLT